MSQYSHLPIFQKSYDLFKILHLYVAYFPRSDKFTLGQQIKSGALDFLKQIIKVNSSYQKKTHLEEANLLLEVLRINIRLAFELKILGLKKYTHASLKIDEIGRMLGGWLKANV